MKSWESIEMWAVGYGLCDKKKREEERGEVACNIL
jgi:hypothetical protein